MFYQSILILFSLKILRPIQTLLVLFLFTTVNAQKIDSFEIEGGVHSSKIEDNISLYLSSSYNYWLNSYIGVKVGIMALYSDIDKTLHLPKGNSVYYLKDNIINLNCVTAFKFSTPEFKNIGMMADLNFLFEPIPFNSISFKKHINDNENKSKNKLIFTYFNPSYNLQLSIYYNIKWDNKVLQLALGGGISNYNPYNTYYRAKIDNFKLKNSLDLRTSKPAYSVFLRMSFLRFI